MLLIAEVYYTENQDMPYLYTVTTNIVAIFYSKSTNVIIYYCISGVLQLNDYPFSPIIDVWKGVEIC